MLRRASASKSRLGECNNTAEIESVVSSFAVRQNSGLIALPHALTNANRNLILALELRHRAPTVFGGSAAFAKAGGRNVRTVIHQFYCENLAAADKKSKVAIVAVMRKMITTLNGSHTQL